MSKYYEEIYVYNGDLLLGLAKLFVNIGALNKFRLYMSLSNYRLAKEYWYGY